ncbi:hypothetical protein [Sphingobacterium mizutaii]|nr:hypothetical protein [Sphingobacterium mizutaii]
MDVDPFLKKFLPVNYSEQDVKYLKARYNWEKATDNENRMKWGAIASLEYFGTTFQKRNYPKMISPPRQISLF